MSEKSSSKRKQSEDPANSKKALKRQRQAQRPHFDTLSKAKEIWNTLRTLNVQKGKYDRDSESAKLCTELFKLLEGKLLEVALKHDASRVVQALVKFASPKQRMKIVVELKPKLGELSRNEYAHFIVLKLLAYCREDDEFKLIASGLKGQICKLACHSVGARVVEVCLNKLPVKFSRSLKMEFYGPYHALLGGDSVINDKTNKKSSQSSLKSIVEGDSTTKKNTMNFVKDLLVRCLQKELLTFQYVHQLLADYIDAGGDIEPMISNMSDNAIHLLSTRSGSVSMCHAIGHADNKNRKKIMRSFKGYTRSSLTHRDAYIAVLKLLAVNDDTMALNKNILAELTSSDEDANWLELAEHESAHKLFLLLLAPSNKSYFDPFEIEILFDGPAENSKKDPETRRLELLKYLKDPLIDFIKSHTREFMTSKYSALVLRELYFQYPSAELANAILAVCDSSNNNDEEEFKLFEDPAGHLLIKKLLLQEHVKKACHDDDDENNFTFTSLFVERFKTKMLEKVGYCNRGAFVLSALLEDNQKTKNDDDDEVNEDLHNVRKIVLQELKKKSHLATIKKRAKEGQKGFQVLESALKQKK